PGLRLDRNFTFARCHRFALDFDTLAHVLGEVLAGDERVPRRLLTAIFTDLCQHIIPARSALYTPDHGHILSTLDLDFGIRRGLSFLRLRVQACGTHRD